jgi:thioredoxin reductase
MKTSSSDILIVGAGPAGLGCALALEACGLKPQIVDARGIASSFESWPRQMKLLTPSFHSNAFGAVDLNSISPETSPADFLHTQHPDGGEYARYLRSICRYYELHVNAPVRVERIQPQKDGSFTVQTQDGTLRPRFLIWAAGELGLPDDGGIEGSDLCIHSSRVRDWEEMASTGEKFTLIGGYESGIDAAIHFMEAGREVHLLSRGEPWGEDDPDPSRSLSPRTRDRLRLALLNTTGDVRFYKNANIVSVKKTPLGYEVLDTESTPFISPTPPILCTGFRNALEPIRDLWEWKNGSPVFTEAADESTLTPNLFYSGPTLCHRSMLFCFIYKYRSRFGVIAREIASRMGRPWEESLKLWRERGFMMENLDCCTDCGCAVEPESAENPEVTAYAEV